MFQDNGVLDPLLL